MGAASWIIPIGNLQVTSTVKGQVLPLANALSLNARTYQIGDFGTPSLINVALDYEISGAYLPHLQGGDNYAVLLSNACPVV